MKMQSHVNLSQKFCNFCFVTDFLFSGGYNFVNTAKAWTTMIAAILQKEISSDIPDHEVSVFQSSYPNEVTVLYNSITAFFNGQAFSAFDFVT